MAALNAPRTLGSSPFTYALNLQKLDNTNRILHVETRNVAARETPVLNRDAGGLWETFATFFKSFTRK